MDDDLAGAKNGKPIRGGSTSFHPRILLAEDEPDHQRLMSLVLRKLDADVTIAENGHSAVDLALRAQERGNQFDLILMDIRMPVEDGYLATRHLREAGYRLPIVALTADAMMGDRERFIAAGGDDYISKPLAVGELVKLVKGWAKQAHRINPS